MSDGFYLQDVEHMDAKGVVVSERNKLFFRQSQSGFDGVATKEHVKSYGAHFGNFKKANPNYKLPEHLKHLEVGSPIVGMGSTDATDSQDPEIGSPKAKPVGHGRGEDAPTLSETEPKPEELHKSDKVKEHKEEVKEHKNEHKEEVREDHRKK